MSHDRDDFTDAVVAVVASIEPGTVMAYGEIAEEAGYPGAARAVGNVIRRVAGLPWWRVVTASGRLVPGHEKEHAERLRAEGVRVHRGRVVAGSRPPSPRRGTAATGTGAGS